MMIETTNAVETTEQAVIAEKSGGIGERIGKLIEVKSLLSFVVIGGVTYGFIKGMVTSEMYCSLATSIVTYFFTRQVAK